MHVSPGCSKHELFCKEAEITDEDEDPIICNRAVADEDEIIKIPSIGTEWMKQSKSAHFEDESQKDFDLNKMTKCELAADENDETAANDSAQLLRHHYQFGHMPFNKLQALAKQGIIPKKHSKCMMPACASCLCAKSAKRQWRSKTSVSRCAELVTAPGQATSADQLASPTPGLIAQMTGKLTTKRHKHATVHADQFSRLGYAYLQKTATAEETLEGKRAFELCAQNNGVNVRGYHADNGMFRANKWVLDCKLKN